MESDRAAITTDASYRSDAGQVISPVSALNVLEKGGRFHLNHKVDVNIK